MLQSSGDSAEDAKDYCFARGYIPTETEMEFTVEGISSYVQKLDEIPTDAYDKMNQHAQAVLTADVAETWGEAEELRKSSLSVIICLLLRILIFLLM